MLEITFNYYPSKPLVINKININNTLIKQCDCYRLELTSQTLRYTSWYKFTSFRNLFNVTTNDYWIVKPKK